MAVPVNMSGNPKKDTGIGRRLFAMGASILGGAFGGPAGAAAGGAIGGEVAGTNEGDGGGGGMGGMLGGLMGGGKAAAAPAAAQPVPTSGLNFGPGLQKPELGDSAFSRRLSSKSQEPSVAIQEGLNALTMLPPDLREQYTGPLVKAQMNLGGANARRRY